MSRFKIRRYYMDRPGDSPWVRLKHRLTRRPTPAFPRTIQIQTVTGCNADCVFCSYGETYQGQPKGRMTDDLFRSLIDEAAEHDVRRVSPYLMNEPLLDRTLLDKIRYINRKMPSTKVVVTTNGHDLTSDTAEAMLDLGPGLHEVHVSVQGVDRGAYARTMRGPLDLDRTIANVEGFLAAQRRRGTGRPRLWVTMVDTAWIDARAAVVWWRGRGVNAKYTFLENLGGNVAADDLARAPLRPYTTCARLFKQAYVLFNGDMVLCCADWSRKQVLGNVTKDGLGAVWNGPIAREIRGRYLDGRTAELALCGSCRVGDLREVVLSRRGREVVSEPAV